MDKYKWTSELIEQLKEINRASEDDSGCPDHPEAEKFCK